MSDIQIDPITKEGFERWVDETGETILTDEQWEKVKDEIEGRVENFIDGLLGDIVLDYREGHYDEEGE